MPDARDVERTLVRVIRGVGDPVEYPPRKCRECGETKPHAAFGKSYFTGAPNPYCRECVKRATVKRHTYAQAGNRDSYIRELAAELGLVLEDAEVKDADGNVIESDEEPFVPGAIWDLKKPETLLRLDVACDRAFRAYMRSSEAHGFAEMGRHMPELRREAEAIAARAETTSLRKESSMGIAPDVAEKNRTERRSKLLAYLEKHGPTDGNTLRDVLDLSKGEWMRLSSFLRDAGELAVDGVKRAARWRLASQKPAVNGEARKSVPAERPRRATTSGPKANGSNGHAHKANGVSTAPSGALDMLLRAHEELTAELDRVSRAIAILQGP